MRWLAFVALVGCSGIQTVTKAPPSALELTTIFVYPVKQNGFEASPARAFELSNRALTVAVAEAGERLAFYAPSEFQVLKADAENAWLGSDALPLLVKSGSRADQGAVLKVIIERRVASSATQTETMKGQNRGGSSNEETTWLVRAEVHHPTSATTLIEVQGQVTVDPFAAPPPEAEFDASPQLTALVGTLVGTAIKHAKQHASGSRAVASPSTVVFVATPVTAGAGGPDESDPMQREIALQNRARQLSPAVTEALASKLGGAPKGAAVVTGDAKLSPLDVVLTVDGVPALPNVLARVRFKGAPAELEVKRASGATEQLVWP